MTLSSYKHSDLAGMVWCLWRRGGPYVVIPGGPGRVELHVELSLLPGELVVLGLLLPGQRVPLQDKVNVMLGLFWFLPTGLETTCVCVCVCVQRSPSSPESG